MTVGGMADEFRARTGPNEVWMSVPDLGEELDVRPISAVRGPTTVCVPDVEAGRPAQP